MGRRADAGAEPTTGRRSRPTLSDIAEEAGVSTATVSKVLNGRTDVASATRARVTALLKTHNYLAHAHLNPSSHSSRWETNPPWPKPPATP